MDALLLLISCIGLIGFWIAFNWKDTLQDKHNREKSKKWKKKMKQFKKNHPDVDTSNPKYEIKKDR